jgi:hypothetical protein
VREARLIRADCCSRTGILPWQAGYPLRKGAYLSAEDMRVFDMLRGAT